MTAEPIVVYNTSFEGALTSLSIVHDLLVELLRLLLPPGLLDSPSGAEHESRGGLMYDTGPPWPFGPQIQPLQYGPQFLTPL